MDPKDQIISLLKEADLYQKQGLLNEAKGKYKKATEIIRVNPSIKNGADLIASIVKKVVDLNQKINDINQAASKPTVSDQKQELIKNLFAGSGAKDDCTNRLEGAIALAKFGQFERALEEFERLLDVDTVRVAAAKNIVRCHLEVDALEDAAQCFERWVGDDRFASAQLDKIRFFLEGRLRKAGFERELYQKEETVSDEDMEALEMVSTSAEASDASEDRIQLASQKANLEEFELPDEDEFLDINSVGIQFHSGPQKGEMVEFDVSFQTGNSINLIISSKEQALLDELERGTKLNDLQFFSPIAILNGSGVVTAKTQIKSGPKEGDYSLDITILTT
jgi:tetratricopeptide (TPR) repeat protein